MSSAARFHTRTRPLTGNFCLELSPLVVYPVIDRLLGGGAGGELFIVQPSDPVRVIFELTRLDSAFTIREH